MLGYIDRNSQKGKIMKYKEGQVWVYNNRLEEISSKVVILKVENGNDGESIVHIFVDGLKINNPNSDENIEEITHMPFALDAIEKSLIKLVGERELPDYEDGYKKWKKEYENKSAGIFSITVGESIKYMDKTINS